MKAELPPKFQFAFRRTIFFLLCVCLWICFGTLVLASLCRVGHTKAVSSQRDRIDAKRVELLNVLWAETIAKTENDWAEMANQKLEMYEKTLLSALGVNTETNERGLYASLRKAFSLVTTIGPVDIDDFTTFGKIFAVFFTLIGTPLCLNVIAQCGRMVQSIWEGRSVFIPTVCFIFVSAVVYDIVEGGDDDVPFTDALFSIFLQFSTVGEVDNEFHGVVPYCMCIVGLSLVSAMFSVMQQEIERSIQGFELKFYRIFSYVERWLNEERDEKENNVGLNSSNSTRNSRIEEIEEEEEEED